MFSRSTLYSHLRGSSVDGLIVVCNLALNFSKFGLLTARRPHTSVLMYASFVRLQELNPEYLTVEDESAGEESKFMILVVSKAFEGLNTLKRHRQVYSILDEEMKIVHAVTLQTKTPEQVGL